MKMKTLEKFLKENNAGSEGFEFAKDLTLEQFLNTCEKGGWILWLFARTNSDDLTKLTEAKALCANTVRHLMKDERSTNAIDVALKFAKNEATKEELNCAARAAYHAAAAYYDDAAFAAAFAARAAYAAAYAAADAVNAARAANAAADHAAAANAADHADDARKRNRKLTADICRQALPLEIWNQSQL